MNKHNNSFGGVRTTYRQTMMLFGLLGAMCLTQSASARELSIRLISTPRGATVYLDRLNTAPLCDATPCRAWVEVGKHEFIFVKKGYISERVAARIHPKRLRVRGMMRLAASLNIQAGTAGMEGASISVNGREVGKVPSMVSVEPGRVFVQIQKDGFQPFEKWLDLAGADIANMAVVLEKATGNIFVSADLENATIYVDGQSRGTTPLSVTVPAGPVLFEIVSPDGRRIKKQMVVASGAKDILDAKFADIEVESGALAVSANVDGAVITLDGREIGKAPFIGPQVNPGTYALRVVAPGYRAYETNVVIAKGKQAMIKAELVAEGTQGTLIDVTSPVSDARVYIDGIDRGSAPVTLRDLPSQRYTVVVRKDGYKDVESVCDLAVEPQCSRRAELQRWVKVDISSNAPGAQVFIDGRPLGPAPYSGNLTEGMHEFVLSAEGYHDLSQQITLAGDLSERELAFTMQSVEQSKRKARSETATQHAGASRFTGVPIEPNPDVFVFDTMFRMPSHLGLFGNVGLTDKFALGIGVDVLERNIGLGLVDLYFQGHYGMRLQPAFSFGAQLEAGFSPSVGDAEISSFRVAARGMATLHFSNRASATLDVQPEFISDRWKDFTELTDAPSNGQSLTRLLGGITLTVWFNDETTGLVLRGQRVFAGAQRILYRDAAFTFVEEDPLTYGSAGLVFKF